MEKQYEIGVLGLGVMGASLAKNMIRHGFDTAVYSISEEERERFRTAGETGGFAVFDTLERFVGALKTPRKVFLMITAGKAVDAVLEQLLPLLERGDIVMDGGNSYYRDTERRFAALKSAKIHFLGVGVSGGEEGALNGPSMMVGGSRQGWEEVRRILLAIAASHGKKPCCAYIAPGGAGHYVKMVHNGIEYAILELIAEAYHLLRYVRGMDPETIRDTFAEWNKGMLSSYLMEISVKVLEKREEDGELLIDRILDVAGQKGTGKWTVQDAIERGVYVPTIYEAQAIRAFSAEQKARQCGAERLACHPLAQVSGTEAFTAGEMGQALLLAIVAAYSQGLELIAKASEEEGWQIDFAGLCGVWENGCIIRSRLLEEIGKAKGLEELPLLLSGELSFVDGTVPALRKVTAASVALGNFAPGFGTALQYYDAYRAKRLPLNFVQGLRDCFGAHTYQRTDRDGVFHTQW